MPVLEVHLLEGYDDDAKGRLGRALTDAVRTVVPAPPDAVTIMIHEMAKTSYMRGRTHRTGAPALADPCTIVRDFLAAMEARDLDVANSMLGARFTMTFPGSKQMHSLAELIDWASGRYKFVKKSYDAFESLHSGGAHMIVYCHGTLSGEWPCGTPFDAIRFIDRFEITDGLLTRQDVWNDISEHKAPS